MTDAGLAALPPVDYGFVSKQSSLTTMADDICEMRPQGRIDSATGPAFEKDVLRQIDDGQRRLLLDFAELQYISSAGLRIVLLAAKRMKAAGGKLALCSLNPQIAEVFEISGFSRILDIHPSRDAALATLSGT
jgi:anti-anti-sigma factor